MPGQYQDAETGFHYNYHRYYDPRTGRYLSPDPIGQAGGINLYTYVGNNPINAVDPYGLRVRLLGQSHDRYSLLATLQSFIRGRLLLTDEGYINRDPCEGDEDYDKLFDRLIGSASVYNIQFGSLFSSEGGWAPGDFDQGGTITIEKDPTSSYIGIKGFLRIEPGIPHTRGTILAHEVGHAISHVLKMDNSDIPYRFLSESERKDIERDANKLANQVMARMGKLRRYD